ncbi:MAG TPA: condensation domain-containing protein, partial [Bacillota bacterium]|nr:condensation domain-containing protein [Bacillota bacterium]
KHQAEQGIVQGEFGLIPIQKYFLNRNFSDKHHWNVSLLLFSEADIDEPAFIKAISKVTAHHDALRIVFRFDGGAIRQYNRGLLEGELFSLKVFDYRNEAGAAATIVKEIKAIHTSMDLATGPLLKFGLFKTREGNHLLIAIHHLVADAVSQQFITEDLISGYLQALRGQDIQLPAKTDSLLDYSKAIYQYAESPELSVEAKYWEGIVATEAPPLPKDGHPGRNRISDSVYHQTILLSAAETDRLQKASRRSSRDLQTLLLAGLGYAIKEWSQNSRIPVTLIGHGRENVVGGLNITRTAGWISLGYPVILEMDCPADIDRQAHQIQETLARVPNHGVGHDILRYINEHFGDYRLNVEILFNFIGQDDDPRDGDNPPPYVVSPISALIGHDVSMTYETDRDYTFMMTLMIQAGALCLEINYNRHEYHESTVAAIAAAYAANLGKIINHYLSETKMEQ